jgi:membrane protease YdiL (CAAX protease family)
MTDDSIQDQSRMPDTGAGFLPAGPSPGLWDFGRALLFFFFLVGGTIAVGVALLLLFGFKASALLTELGLYLMVPYLLSRFLDTGWQQWMRRPHLSLGGWMSMLLALFGLGVLISNIPVAVDSVYPMSEEYREFFETFLRADSTGEFIVLLVIAAIVPGICEEITFRGLIHQGIRTTFGPQAAVVITGVLFAVIHLSPWNFLALIFMGLFLGLLREKTGSIWPGVVAHTVNNTLALTLITVAPPQENAWQYDYFPWWLNLTALAVLVLGMLLFLRQVGPRTAPGPAGQEGY